MKYYINLFKIRVITSLQYRADAIAGIATQLFFGLVYIMVYLAFYQYGNNSSVGMNWGEMVTYLWLQQSFLAMTFVFTKDNEFLKIIKDGNICYEISKPQNFFIKRTIKMIAKKYTETFLRCFPMIIIAFLLPIPYKMSMPSSFGNFIIFIFGLLFSCILNSILITIVHLLVMFTIDSRGLFAIYGTIADLFTGSLIPLPLLPQKIQNIAKYLPFKYIQDFPYRVYSNNISIHEGTFLLINSIIWIIILIIIGLLVNKLVLKKAVINGG